MKGIAITLASFVFFTAHVSQAVFNPSWERPIQAAEMRAYTSQGTLSKIKTAHLTLTKRDGSRMPTGMILSLNGQSPMTFVVTSAEKGACMTTYNATLVLPSGVQVDSTVGITLYDHNQATGMCTARFMAPWVADVFAASYGRQMGKVELLGSPKGVITPQ